MATRELSDIISCKECDIDNCKCSQTRIYVLQEYQQWLHNEQDNYKHENSVNQFIEKLSISTKAISTLYKHIN